MIPLLLAALIAWPPAGRAQFSNNAVPLYKAEGQAVVFRIVPGARSAKLYVVGKDALSVDLSRETRKLKVSATFGGKTRELRVTNEGDAFVVSPWPELKHEPVLNIKAEVRGKAEDVRLPLKTP